MKRLSLIISILLFATAAHAAYPIVAIRAPRRGNELIQWQEVVQPANVEPGSHLVVIQPDGTESMLVDAGANGAILDPCPSLDGKWVYYSHVTDAKSYSQEHAFGSKVAYSGADIYKINVETKQIIRLTHQEFTPNTGLLPWSKSPMKSEPAGTHYVHRGIYNTGACPVPGGRVVFTSDRDNLMSPRGGWSFPTLQLYVMDEDGKNVEKVGHLNIAGALHPFLMKNGWIGWSSWESQGFRNPLLWGLWASHPDGANWEPLLSAFTPFTAIHFASQKSDGEVAAVHYYNQNNNGFGTILGFPAFPAANPRFGSPDIHHASNPNVPLRYVGVMFNFKFSFSPIGLRALTNQSNHFDQAADHDPAFPGDDSKRLGKYTHPSNAPGNDLLAIYSPGPACHNTPTPYPIYQGVLVRLPQGHVNHPSEHVTIKADPNFNYQQPKALVPIADIYGEVPELPYVPNDGTKHALLPEGTPFGLVGTSSFYKRDSAGVTTITGSPSAWSTQGSDSGKYSNSEIHAVRIVQTEPQTNLSPVYKDGLHVGGLKTWRNPINERLRILGEIPLRKPGVVDPDGNPDTSFLARIPADVPFTFQTVDKDGLVLNMAQTWHQVRPGEIRNNCGGCHAHSQPGLDFGLTAAANPAYQILTLAKARDREFDRDVWPIIEAKCTTCHNDAHPTLVMTTAEKAFTNLVPADTTTTGRVMGMRPRESSFLWKLHGKVLDGSGNALQGARMPLNSDPLTDAELRTIAEWIGLGAARGVGSLADDLRPTLTVTHPTRNEAAKKIVIGSIDSGSELKAGSLKVSLNGSDITSKFSEANNVWTGTLDADVAEGELVAEVSDNAGNVNRVVRTFKGVASTCESELAAAQAEIERLNKKIADAIKVLE